MTIKTINYLEIQQSWPDSGQHILGYQDKDTIVVYQAYKNSIANFAVKNQVLGGSDFSYNRMSWIKPNFLWMMYRCGWAEKENQERVIAIWINKSDFETILDHAVLSSFNSKHYEHTDQWKQELDTKDVRLQWDPDHDPYGNKLIRRAIQLGLKGSTLEKFGKEQIKQIEDVTDFVKEQKRYIDAGQLNKLMVPAESVFMPSGTALSAKIGIEQQG
jgi:hypothetical protein